MQIIPESIVVTAGCYNKVYALVDDVTLEAGKKTAEMQIGR